jgi:hypothetical protein
MTTLTPAEKLHEELKKTEPDQAPKDTSHTQELLERSRYNELTPPIHSPAVASIDDTEVIWKGNVHTLVAGSKVGKSRFLAALIKSTVHGERSLGWSANKGGEKIIYMDFEQDHEDFYSSMKDQAGVTKDEVYAYNLAGTSAVKAVECMDVVLGMHSDAAILILDGMADLCNNVNDAEESNALIAHLMEQANKHDIAIVGVLHLNPGSEAKSRGHLGSQLERKSKTIIQINEKDGVRTVFTKLARKKPIREKDGPRFAWCDDTGNFAELTETRAQMDLRKKGGELRDLMDEILKTRTIKTLSNKELKQAVMDHTGQGERTASTRIREMVDLEILTIENKLYSMTE